MATRGMVSIRLGEDIKEMIRLVAEADRKPGRSVSVSDWCMKAIMAKLIMHPRYVEFAEKVYPDQFDKAGMLLEHPNEKEATNDQTQ